MHPFEELQQDGQLGPAGLQLMQLQVGQIVRRRNYPPPDGHQSWTADAINEMLNRIVEIRPRMTMRLYEKATDAISFERLLRKSLDSAIVDIGRDSPVGRMVRRLRTILGAIAKFVRVTAPSGWALDGLPLEPTTRTRADMLRAALTVSGDVPYLNRAGRTPAATRALFAAVAEAVILDASGSVSESDMATTIVNRFDLQDEPRLSADDSDEDAAWDVDEAASELWSQLDEDQQAIVPFMEGGSVLPAEVATRFGEQEVAYIRHEIATAALAIAGSENDALGLIARLVAFAGAQPSITSSDEGNDR